MSDLNNEVQELKKELSRYKALLDGIPCTVSWIGSDLRYRMVNKKLADALGLEREEIIGQKIGFTSERQSGNNNMFNEFTENFVKSNCSSMQKELRVLINDKEKYFWITAIKVEKTQDFLLFGIDITEIVTLRESVTLLSKLSLLGEISAGIVHEINNPLQVIMGKARKIERALTGTGDHDNLKSAKAVGTHSKRISKIVKSIKLFVHDAKADDVQDSRQISEILQEVNDICAYLFSKKSIDFQINVEDYLIPNNSTMVYQILVNLISNAADAISDLDERWIKVDSELTETSYIIKVQDSGLGIDDEIVEKIFNPFYTSKPVGKGTGLGLHLSLKMAKELGGNLYYEKCDGRTTFYLSYPR